MKHAGVEQAPCAPAPTVVLIAAVARNGVIGGGNRLLWRLSEDMDFFRRTTTGHTVIMGRKTWDSLPPRFRPLPERRNIVLSRDTALRLPGAETAASLTQALALAGGEDEVFVIGGAQIYAQAVPLAQRLVLTEIDADFEGDSVFPDWPRDQFVETLRTRHDPQQGLAYSRGTYQRRAPG